MKRLIVIGGAALALAACAGTSGSSIGKNYASQVRQQVASAAHTAIQTTEAQHPGSTINLTEVRVSRVGKTENYTARADVWASYPTVSATVTYDFTASVSKRGVVQVKSTGYHVDSQSGL